jgi:hypothetical protein
MQPEVIPFDLTGRSFVLAILLLTAIVYAIRCIIRYGLSRWPLWQRRIALGIKRQKLGESGDEVLKIRFHDKFPPMTGIHSDRIMGDEEIDVLRTYETKALLRPSVVLCPSIRGIHKLDYLIGQLDVQLINSMRIRIPLI